MTIRQRLALGYAVITIPLTAFAAISFYMMESKVKSIGEFHAPALSSYQKLMSDAMEAVQESFAYVASGEEIERHDFLVWANGFSAEAAGFRSFTGMHNPGEETERALFDAIEVIQADLVKKAHLMFREYDTAGSISLSTFSDYEQTVDELSMLFKAFLEIERQEMSGAHRRATTTISHSQEIIIALGALSVILAFASGLFVVRSISESAGKMKDAMSKVAAGNLDVSLSVDSNDEFGKLADSFHRMTADLRDARSELRATLDYIDNILGSMNDSLVVVTPELRIQTVNQATCDLLGYSKDEIIGLPFTSIVSNGESRKLGLGNLYRLEEANLPEISYRSRDGRLIPVSFSGSLLRGKNGSLLGVVCVTQDLTERKQAEMRRANGINRLSCRRCGS
ncbi:MAG: PAS domain S-box protein [Candidatus Zixiibacteriota bacterium]